VELPFPDARGLWPAFLATQRAETAFTHRRLGLFPARAGEYGEDVRERLRAASRVTLDEYLAAQLERQRLRAAFDALFADAAVLVTPIAARTPPPIATADVEEVARQAIMEHTAPHDLVGVPSCAVRAGFDDAGVPVGVQLAGPRGADGRVLAAAQVLFAATPDVQAPTPRQAGRFTPT